MRLFKNQDLMQKVMAENSANEIYQLLTANTVKETE